MDDNETQRELQRRYPNTRGAPEPPRSEPIDPELIRRYPTMATPSQREEAARALAPEIVPPPGIDAASPQFAAVKVAARAAGLDSGSVSRFLTEYEKALAGGGK